MANGSSTIDYVLISSSIFSDISNFEVLPVTLYSVQSQLKFCLDIPNVTYPYATPGKILESRIKYNILTPSLKTLYQNYMRFARGKLIAHRNGPPVGKHL